MRIKESFKKDLHGPFLSLFSFSLSIFVIHVFILCFHIPSSFIHMGLGSGFTESGDLFILDRY